MGADKKAGIPVAIRPWYSVAPQNTLEYTHSNTWISMENYGTSRKRKARKPLLVAGFLGRAWKLFDFKMVPEVGIEPTRTEVRWILSPVRRPVSPLRHFLRERLPIYQRSSTYCKSSAAPHLRPFWPFHIEGL